MAINGNWHSIVNGNWHSIATGNSEEIGRMNKKVQDYKETQDAPALGTYMFFMSMFSSMPKGEIVSMNVDAMGEHFRTML